MTTPTSRARRPWRSLARSVNAYATYATSFKSVGLNLNGVPTDAFDRPVLTAATVKPEDEHHVEIGLKTAPLPGVTANVTVFNTDINDFQAQVVNADVGVLRGYLANAEKVRVRGVEFDGNAKVTSRLSFYNAIVHRRQIRLVPRRAAAARGHGWPAGQGRLRLRPAWHLEMGGLVRRRVYLPRDDARPRRGVLRCVRRQLPLLVFSSASASRYLVIDGYSLVNTRVGFRWSNDWALCGSGICWTRSIELLSAAPGNSGLYVGLPGDPRTLGVTMRVSLR